MGEKLAKDVPNDIERGEGRVRLIWFLQQREGRTSLKGSNLWEDILGKGESREKQPGEAQELS